jgi:hypothetical protein
MVLILFLQLLLLRVADVEDFAREELLQAITALTVVPVVEQQHMTRQ